MVESVTLADAGARTDRRRVADPWILGLYGLASATFVVAASMARWYGGADAAAFSIPFVVTLGGLATFLAAMWAYWAGDALATAMLGTWGAFWLGYGLLNLLIATGRLPQPHSVFIELGIWFVPLAAITWMGMVAARAENQGLVAVLGCLAAGSTLAVFADMLGIGVLTVPAGWLLVISAVCAWYTATAMMFAEMFGHEVLPLGRGHTRATSSGASPSWGRSGGRGLASPELIPPRRGGGSA
jgi:succinate-acetate transporter protein